VSTSSITNYSQDELVGIMATAFAAKSNINVRDDEGEPLGNMWRAFALCTLVISQNLGYVNNKARLQTSGNVSGAFPANEYSPDVDSFCNVFNIFRDKATESVGTETFTPASASTTDQYILPGTLVQTTTGTPIQFVVVADSTQGSYTTNGYLVPASSTSPVSVTVQCILSGTVGNVSAGTITSLVSGLGTTTPLSAYSVTNPQAFTNGINGETDAALYVRFCNEFISGRWATRLAILTAIAGTQANLTYQIVESYNGSTPAVGWFTVYANITGSNSTTPSSVLAAITSSISATKALGISFVVLAPALEVIPVVATITHDPTWTAIPGNTNSVLQANVQAAYDAYVNGIGLSSINTTTLLSYAKVSSVLVSVPGVLNISSFTLNGGTSDITAAVGTQFIAGSATLTVI
jgi:hypothetical protein